MFEFEAEITVQKQSEQLLFSEEAMLNYKSNTSNKTLIMSFVCLPFDLLGGPPQKAPMLVTLLKQPMIRKKEILGKVVFST